MNIAYLLSFVWLFVFSIGVGSIWDYLTKFQFQRLGQGFHMTSAKIQAKKLSIFLSFYFHEVLQRLKPYIYRNFRFQGVFRFAIEDTWISRLLRDAAFSWPAGKALM